MKRFQSNPAQRRNHYHGPTDKIVAALVAGTVPWRRPWDRNARGGA
jgi:antirestriction protein ArdC